MTSQPPALHVWLPPLSALDRRLRRAEIMDQEDLDPRAHEAALRGLERINRLSGSNGVLWREVCELFRTAPARPLRLLDVATGAGDVPLRLWRWARRTGLPLEVAGCDRSAVAVAHAQRRARELGAQVTFFPCDVFRDPLPADFDVLTSSLFLHHLDEAEAVTVLRALAAAARRLVLVNDLERSLPGLLLAVAGTRLLSRSPVVHHDGPWSVAAAFTVPEARRLARAAGLTGARVTRCWPWRWLLTWRPDLSFSLPSGGGGSGWGG